MKFNQDQGADYFVTQVFFDNDAYLRFRDQAVKAGVTAPIIPGIQPLASVRYLQTMPPIFGCSVPDALAEKVREHASHPEEVRQIGVDWCVEQALELRREGVPGLHFYANRNNAVGDVLRKLR